MPIVLPGNKTMTLYAQPGGGYGTVQPTSGVSDGNAALGYTADDAAHGTLATLSTDGTYDFGDDFTETSIYMFGDDWRVDGVEDSYFSGLNHGGVVAPTSSTMFETDNGHSKQKYTSGTRHSRLSSMVKVFGKPTSAGGLGGVCTLARPLGRMGGSNPPARQWQYFAWRCQYSGNMDHLKRHLITVDGVTGTFQAAADGHSLGEQCTITLSNAATTPAWFIHYDSVNRHMYFYWPEDRESPGYDRALLQTGTIVGNTSGATATFASGATAADVAWESGNPKDFRVAENATGTYLTSFGAIHSIGNYTMRENNGTIYNDAAVFTSAEKKDATTGHWYHHQLIYDKVNRVARFKVDNAVREVTWSATYEDPTKGFNIFEFGLENNQKVIFTGAINEFIANDSPLRIGISDSSTAAGIDYNTLETCYVKSVSGNTCVFEINRGAYADSDDLYIYFFNDVTLEPANSSGLLLPGVA